jgi:hypothetical protein
MSEAEAKDLLCRLGYCLSGLIGDAEAVLRIVDEKDTEEDADAPEQLRTSLDLARDMLNNPVLRRLMK